MRPLRTVYSMLEELGGLQMLEDSLMEVATAEIVAGGPGSRPSLTWTLLLPSGVLGAF